MVQRPADRLAAQPADVQGWRRLARAYETLARHEATVQAYRQPPADAAALCELDLVPPATALHRDIQACIEKAGAPRP